MPPYYNMPPNGAMPTGIGGGYSGGSRGSNAGDPRYHGDWSREYPPENYRRGGAGSSGPPGVNNSSAPNVEYDRRPPPPQT